MRAMRVEVKWTDISSSTGMFIKTSLWWQRREGGSQWWLSTHTNTTGYSAKMWAQSSHGGPWCLLLCWHGWLCWYQSKTTYSAYSFNSTLSRLVVARIAIVILLYINLTKFDCKIRIDNMRALKSKARTSCSPPGGQLPNEFPAKDSACHFSLFWLNLFLFIISCV